ncbi:PilZ domain-containing protein [Tsuneonella sp. YG55]|uniref:PilZ domain-containing protein n=1 Tax=Tsuneonella litorea TaxID=2976475 RepID=A0A9X3AN06_9SPHN|nr:PilZ domain-containing protein [Tsuneonella litorea]MCT2559037.1 PilZ domain-containing protein [Tsuneonella litorea]
MSDEPEDQSGDESSRQFARLEVGISARLDTLSGRQSVRLVNLSQGGAQLILSVPDEAGEGMLTWLDFEMFGELAWQKGDRVGLTFDEPLAPLCLAETRRRAPSVVLDEAMGASFTKAWVSGEIGDD